MTTPSIGVGDQLTHEQIEQLPVGTNIRCSHGTFTREAERWVNRVGNNSEVMRAATNGPCNFTLESMPEPDAEPAHREGTIDLSMEDFNALPVGTILTHYLDASTGRTRTLTKDGSGNWVRNGLTYNASTEGAVDQHRVTAVTRPDELVEPTLDLGLGQQGPFTLAQLDNAPIGTELGLRPDRTEHLACWAKVNVNTWRMRDASTGHTSGRDAHDSELTSNLWYVVHVGLNEDQPLTQEIFESLPPFSVIGLNRLVAIKMADGTWRRESDRDLVVEDALFDNRYSECRFGSYDHQRGAVETEEEPATQDPDNRWAVGNTVNGVEDYSDAPVGTAVQCMNYSPMIKTSLGDWMDQEGRRFTSGVLTADRTIVEPEPYSIGMTIQGSAGYANAPVGTQVSDGDDNVSLTKNARGEWIEPGGAVLFDPFSERTIVGRSTQSEPEPEPQPIDRQVEIRELMDKVKNSIMETREERDPWAREAGFWQLGIDPLPEVDTEIYWGSAFALPISSVVRLRSYDGTFTLYQITNEEPRSGQTVIAGQHQAHGFDDRVTVISLGEWTPPVYETPREFWLAAVAKHDEYAGPFGWCSEVKDTWVDKGLEPNDTPPPVQPEVGDVVNFDDHWAALQLLPVLSTLRVYRGDEDCIAVRTNAGWQIVGSRNVGRELTAGTTGYRPFVVDTIYVPRNSAF